MSIKMERGNITTRMETLKLFGIQPSKRTYNLNQYRKNTSLYLLFCHIVIVLNTCDTPRDTPLIRIETRHGLKMNHRNQ